MLTSIEEIECCGEEETVDISTDGNNLFYADGILTHNSGMFESFDDVDFTHIAEGINIAATADFMAIMGKDEDSLVYESEVHYKLVKNRLGGRVGEIGKFYLDSKSLKMYDESELDLWIQEAKQSGDTVKVKKS